MSIPRAALVLCLGLSTGVCKASPQAAGGKCKEDGDCRDGLVCVMETCADAAQITRTRAKKVQEAAQQFMQTNKGDCPGEGDLPKGDSGRDAWGNAFVITCPGEKAPVDVMSNGADGKPGTGDDLGTAEGAAQ